MKAWAFRNKEKATQCNRNEVWKLFPKGRGLSQSYFLACFGWTGPNCWPDQNQSLQLSVWQQLTNFDCQHSN